MKMKWTFPLTTKTPRGSQAIVQITDLFPQLIQQPSRLEYRPAGFSGVVMTDRMYKLSPMSPLASGSVGVFAFDVRGTNAVLGGQKSVSVY
jgi:hypothetical protein